MTITLDAKIIKAMACLASTDDTRYVLCGIKFELGEKDTRLIATDGRKLGVYRIEGPASVVGEFILPIDWLWMMKIDSRRSNTITIDVSVKSFTAMFKTHTYKGKLVEGNYPAYKHVIPTTPFAPTESFDFSSKLLRGFERCFDYLKPDSLSIFRIKAHNGDVPIFSILCEDPNFYGVQMPVKVNYEIPEWIRE